MDNREMIIQSTIGLIHEKGERLHEITVRDISKRAEVGLGLVNYHFGNKEKLVEVCVERIVNGMMEQFYAAVGKEEGLTPLEKLENLGSMILDYMFAHDAVARISVLADLEDPGQRQKFHSRILHEILDEVDGGRK